MAIIKPSVLPTWADSGDKVQPSDVEIATGWPVTNVPPSRQRFNWFFNYVMNGVRYFTRRGLPDWDSAETYEIGDTLIGNNGKLYRSILGSNLNQVPSTSPTFWTEMPSTATVVPDATVSVKGIARFATTPEYDAGAAGVVMTPANFSATATLGSAGSYPLPGGLILKWGVTSFYNDASQRDLGVQSFPVAFPNSCFNVTATFYQTAYVGDSSMVVVVYDQTAAGFGLCIDSQATAMTSNHAVRWFAIGK